MMQYEKHNKSLPIKYNILNWLSFNTRDIIILNFNFLFFSENIQTDFGVNFVLLFINERIIVYELFICIE